MKINCVGGGPAGLYFAILMKRADPRHEIHVWERNAPDDTFGWGVVFSEETLGNLDGADPETYAALTRGFARWDAIDVHVHGEKVRSGGHGFCGISRRRMLDILQKRAADLDVRVHFKHDVTDFESLRDCDLLVAADGVRSRIRNELAHAFKPRLEPHPNRYIWLGTRQKLEAFTFSFRQNEHGVFQVHAYQFEPETSTFIVECDEETFANAGLAAATETESLAYCERLFAPELGGHPLLGNRSSWIQFQNLTNEHWAHENVVLLGDAAHTAHFSIGSGTKLAMEDAIALRDAFSRHSDRDRALASYEAERKPVVLRLQRSAAQSLDWFTNVRRHIKLEAEPFVFSLMSRTRRITRDNLRKRDAAYIEAVDRWYMREQKVPGFDTTGAPIVPAMFTPFGVRGVTLENRVVVSPMCQYSADDGMPNEWHLVHLGSRAVGGAGLVMAEMTDVLADGRISKGCAGLYRDEHVAAWARVTEFIHGHSRAKVGVQIAHAGRKGATERPWEGGRPLEQGSWPIIAPSAIAWDERSQVPREMTRADMKAVRDAHVAAAVRAKQAGFDWLELHAAHGYLLSSFISPLSNQRSDEYGGDVRARARFPLEVLDGIREAWGAGPLSVRISATDWVEQGGFTADDAVELCVLLKEHGADVIDVSAGQTSRAAKPIYGRCFQMPFSERIRNEVGIPTVTVGNITTADQINTILLGKRADLVALARPHLTDPYFTLHAAVEQGFAPHAWPKQYATAAAQAWTVLNRGADT